MTASNTYKVAHALLLLTVVIWGASFALIKDALPDASPFVFNLLRMVLASVILLTLHRKRLLKLTRTAVLYGALIGVFFSLGIEFQTSGLALTTPAKSAFITGLAVIFVPFVVLIPRFRPAGTHRPGWNALLGAVLAFSGLALLTTPAGTHWSELLGSMGKGDLLTVLCAIAFTGHMLAIAHGSPKAATSDLATVQIVVATVILAALLPFDPAPHVSITPRLLIAISYLAVLATAAALTVQTWAQKHIPPAHTAVLLTLEPVFAWLTSLLFLGEHLGRRSLLGAALIFAGILCTEFLTSREGLISIDAD